MKEFCAGLSKASDVVLCLLKYDYSDSRWN